MNTKNLISVVVPVYNVEAFIEECVRSIIAQTYENWECVLIDDGSSDQSGRLCDMLAQQDPRITVIHQSNRGVSYITEADNTCVQLSIVEKMLLKGQGFFIRKMLLLILINSQIQKYSYLGQVKWRMSYSLIGSRFITMFTLYILI